MTKVNESREKKQQNSSVIHWNWKEMLTLPIGSHCDNIWLGEADVCRKKCTKWARGWKWIKPLLKTSQSDMWTIPWAYFFCVAIFKLNSSSHQLQRKCAPIRMDHELFGRARHLEGFQRSLWRRCPQRDFANRAEQHVEQLDLICLILLRNVLRISFFCGH